LKALFDTNILIDYLNGVAEAKAELEYYPEHYLSIISYMEILAGAKNDEEKGRLEAFLGNFRLIPLNRNVARKAVEIRSAHKLKIPDATIWASASIESAILVTRDQKDFPEHPSIRVPYVLD